MMRHRAIILLVLWLLFGGGLLVVARGTGYRLELTIQVESRDEYVLHADIDDRQLRKLQENAGVEIQPFLTQARREFAARIGYREEIYGSENYKMVAVRSYSFVVRDLRQGRIVLRK